MTIKKATKKDVPTIWKLTRELAEYEKCLHECTVTQNAVSKMFFGKNASAECYLIQDKGKIIGMGKLLTVMDTYSGMPYFMLRDFIVRKKYQGQGHGKHFLKFAIDLAQERGYSGIQWNVLSWNKSAIAFYKKTGATTSKTIRMQLDEGCFKELRTKAKL